MQAFIVTTEDGKERLIIASAIKDVEIVEGKPGVEAQPAVEAHPGDPGQPADPETGLGGKPPIPARAAKEAVKAVPAVPSSSIIHLESGTVKTPMTHRQIADVINRP